MKPKPENWEIEDSGYEGFELGFGLSTEEADIDQTFLEFCSRPIVKILTIILLKKLFKYFNSGIQIIVNVEPMLYESVFKIISLIVGCSSSSLEGVATIKDNMGRSYKIQMTLEELPATLPPGRIGIVFTHDKSQDANERQNFMNDIMTVMKYSRLIYVVIGRSPPAVELSVAAITRNLVRDSIHEAIKVIASSNDDEKEEWAEKLKYIGRVPYDVLLFMPLSAVKSAVSTWTPPPPPNSEYLVKHAPPLPELVLPVSVREELLRFINLVKYKDNTGSLLLIGLPVSGKKTIAASIAKELGMPAYHISISNLLSRWVGESESKMKAFFNGMRTTGGLAVFENIELLFKKSKSEGVTDNLRTIFLQEMARDDNNFIMVMTSSENAPSDVLDSPLLGEAKIVIPPPTAEERSIIVKRFLRMIWGRRWSDIVSAFAKRYGLGKEDAEEAVYNTYALPYVRPTAGLTTGEIYRRMVADLLPIMDKVAEGKTVPISKLAEKAMLRDHSARLSKLKKLNETALKLGLADIAKTIKQVADEEMRLDIELRKTLEEYRM